MPDRDREPGVEHRTVRLEERQDYIRSTLVAHTERLDRLEKRLAEIDMTLQRVQWHQDVQPQRHLLTEEAAVARYIEPTLLRVIVLLATALVSVLGGNAYFGN